MIKTIITQPSPPLPSPTHHPKITHWHALPLSQPVTCASRPVILSYIWSGLGLCSYFLGDIGYITSSLSIYNQLPVSHNQLPVSHN